MYHSTYTSIWTCIDAYYINICIYVYIITVLNVMCSVYKIIGHIPRQPIIHQFNYHDIFSKTYHAQRSQRHVPLVSTFPGLVMRDSIGLQTAGVYFNKLD